MLEVLHLVVELPTKFAIQRGSICRSLPVLVATGETLAGLAEREALPGFAQRETSGTFQE